MGAVAYVGGGGGKSFTSYEAAVRVSNSGTALVTVEGGGWIAADGDKLKACVRHASTRLSRRTTVPGVDTAAKPRPLVNPPARLQ